MNQVHCKLYENDNSNNNYYCNCHSEDENMTINVVWYRGQDPGTERGY